MSRFNDEVGQFLKSPAVGLFLERVAEDPVLRGLLALLVVGVLAIKLVLGRSWVETLFWTIGSMMFASFFVTGPGAAWLHLLFGPRSGSATGPAP
jgi:hypothetical protein